MPDIYLVAGNSLTAAGPSTADLWKNLNQGQHHITLSNSERLLSRIQSPQLDQFITNHRTAIHLDRTHQLALYAADQLKDSIQSARETTGCFFGSSRGATGRIEEAFHQFLNGKRLNAATSPVTTLGTLATSVATELQLEGPALALSNACATGLSALGTALAYLQSGYCQNAIVGGSESCLTEFTFAQLKAAKVYCQRPADENYPYQPFSDYRSGMVLGEGSALVSLTNSSTPAALCAISGFAARSEASGLTGISSNADALQRVCREACKQAGLNLAEIDFVIAHGSGTTLGDQAELNAYQNLWPDKLPFITATKWSIGHILGASGLISLIVGAYALQEQKLPKLPYPSRIASTPPPTRLRYGLVTALGFGGQACATVLKKI